MKLAGVSDCCASGSFSRFLFGEKMVNVVRTLMQLCLSVPVVAWIIYGPVPEDSNGARSNIVTVADTIRMVQLGLPDWMLSGFNKYLEDQGLIAHFSPDGQRFVIVIKRGNPDNNTNEYSALLYETRSAFHSPKPDILFTMVSDSNREAVKSLKWLHDGATVAFIGENPGEIPQVYSFNIPTRTLKQITKHKSPVVGFDFSGNGETLAFKADKPEEEVFGTEAPQRNSVVVTTQSVSAILTGACGAGMDPVEKELFIQFDGGAEVKIPMHDVMGEDHPLSLSPDGRFALVAAFVRDVPANWSLYEDSSLHPYVMAGRKNARFTRLSEYILVDIQNKTAEPLLDAPWSYRNDGYVWAPDSKSVVLSGAYLPLGTRDTAENQIRKTQRFVAEINIHSRAIKKMSDQNLQVLRWDSRTNRVILRTEEWWEDHPLMAFEKVNTGWRPVPVGGEGSEPPLRISLEEDLNDPPKVYVTAPKTNQHVLLLDLNPEFSKLQFGQEEAVTWKASDGHEVSGGLYLPPDYEPTRRYPLVIQTHGFATKKFWINGPWNSAFAAQPLAGKGFVVLQIGHAKDVVEDEKYLNTPEEGPRQMAAYEGAIDYLDQRGVIDRERVGIIGFSRTVYYVAYTLTHSKYHIAAATLADGLDGGYFQSIAYPSHLDGSLLNGGTPFGENLIRWLGRSPGFNLDKVDSAVRIEEYGPGSLLQGWEWFSGLSRLTRPVELIYLPNGTHTLVKPWDRLVSQQGNVDWFSFCLKGEEDPDPLKKEQYKRWGALRSLLRNQKTSPETDSAQQKERD